MSIVRYVNKKTGRVALYESTSHYDPVTKSSRPIRKYLGTEDPETGKLIPSSGTRGRKPAGEKENAKKEKETDYKMRIEELRKEIAEKDARIRALEKKNAVLRSDLEQIQSMIRNLLEE